MDREKIDQAFQEMRDDLASIEHDRWAHWQDYMHSLGSYDENGNLILPKEHVDKWKSQISKKFYQLSDEEKDSDREQVDKYLPFIKNRLKEI